MNELGHAVAGVARLGILVRLPEILVGRGAINLLLAAKLLVFAAGLRLGPLTTRVSGHVHANFVLGMILFHQGLAVNAQPLDIDDRDIVVPIYVAVELPKEKDEYMLVSMVLYQSVHVHEQADKDLK